MTRHGVLTMSLVVLLLSACDKKAPKSQFDREYETMVERCKVVATKGEETLCERRSTGGEPSAGARRPALGHDRSDHEAAAPVRLVLHPRRLVSHLPAYRGGNQEHDLPPRRCAGRLWQSGDVCVVAPVLVAAVGRVQPAVDSSTATWERWPRRSRRVHRRRAWSLASSERSRGA